MKLPIEFKRHIRRRCVVCGLRMVYSHKLERWVCITHDKDWQRIATERRK